MDDMPTRFKLSNKTTWNLYKMSKTALIQRVHISFRKQKAQIYNFLFRGHVVNGGKRKLLYA